GASRWLGRGFQALALLALGGWGGRGVAQPWLEGRAADGPALRLSWPAADGDYVVETSATLGPGAAWTLVGEAPTEDGGRWQWSVAAGDAARFFRLRRRDQVPPNRIVETSPARGEDGVAVTREAIFRLGVPLGPGVTPGGADLFAEVGTRRALARAELGSDRRTLTLFFLENLPGSTRVRVTLDGTRLVDATGRPLDADGDGTAGGIGVLEFDTARVAGLAGTGVRGRVMASETNPDGSNRPLANVTVTVDGADETLRAVTGADGTFVLSPAPAGRFFVHVDGRTAVGSAWPGGGYYPFVGKAWEASAGSTNLAGGTGEVFLPWIQPGALQAVSAVAETRVTFSPSVVAANPALAGVEVAVPANSLFSDSGVRGGRVGIAPVAPDRLPEPLPPGLNLPLVITVQTDGASNFDRPVPVRFPNLPDPQSGRLLAPGAKTVLWSFNHDTGR
ncbi:MAG: carboxypeptidase-like regulatory domain-containing protein, partial [Verrucomicrobiota bacterium]